MKPLLLLSATYFTIILLVNWRHGDAYRLTTRSHQHEDEEVDNRLPSPGQTQRSDISAVALALSQHLADMESRLHEQIDRAEQRIEHRVDNKIRPLNNTLTVRFLEMLVYSLSEDVQLGKEHAEKQDDLLQRFQQRTADQQVELALLRRQLQEVARRLQDASPRQDQAPAGTASPGRSSPAFGSGTTSTRLTGNHTGRTMSLPIDCDDSYTSRQFDVVGHYKDTIEPLLAISSFEVRCHVINDSAWTVIQRRHDGSVDFYRDWDEYKRGFGSLDGEFWLGNERIFQLTNQRDYRLRIEMADWRGEHFWAEYDHFRVSDESDGYRLHVSGYRGNAGDSLTAPWNNHDSHQFSTKDRDNDGRFYDSCAQHYRGGWWFTKCFESHLNGIYYVKGSHDNFFVRNGIQWNTIHHHSSLRSAAMMIRPNDEAGAAAAAAGMSPGTI